MPEPTQSTKDEDVLNLARTRYRIMEEAEYAIRRASLEDIKFTYNIDDGQWPAEIKSQRLADQRPCLTSNKLRKFVAVVANQERENRVAVRVRPVDDTSDVEVAQILEDLIREIEYSSAADEIYASAGEQAAAGGFGYWRVLTRIPEDGFDQEIFIEHIENQFSVYMDPRRNYCFISDFMTSTDFKAEYPDADATDFSQRGLGEKYALWYEPDKVRVAEYFQKEPFTRHLFKVQNPDTGQVGVVELKDGQTREDIEAAKFTILEDRKSKSHKVRWYKITGNQILEQEDWPGSEIPVVEVVGDKVNISGKTHKRSLIRDGKDPQRMYNYWLTTETETISLAPKAPYIVTAQEIQGFERDWDEANKKNLPYLKFNPQGSNRPRREPPPQVSQGHMQMMQVANADIKDTLGMFESFLGEPSNERSGRAINMRQQRSQVGTLHFPDNLRRSVVQTGKILIEIIPKVYDTERIVRIRGEEDKEKLVPINQTVSDGEGGSIIINDLSMGKYDVRADVRLYSTRRQETSELMLSAMQYAPDIAPFIVDLVFKYQDSPGAGEIAARVKEFMDSQKQAALQRSGGGGSQNGSGGPGGAVPLPPEAEAARDATGIT
jgi:hypothetical protein